MWIWRWIGWLHKGKHANAHVATTWRRPFFGWKECLDLRNGWMCIEIILEIYKYTAWTKQTPGTCKRARLLEKVVWKSLIQLSCSPINLHLMRLCLAGYMERTCFMLAHLERRCTSFNLGAWIMQVSWTARCCISAFYVLSVILGLYSKPTLQRDLWRLPEGRNILIQGENPTWAHHLRLSATKVNSIQMSSKRWRKEIAAVTGSQECLFALKLTKSTSKTMKIDVFGRTVFKEFQVDPGPFKTVDRWFSLTHIEIQSDVRTNKRWPDKKSFDLKKTRKKLCIRIGFTFFWKSPNDFFQMAMCCQPPWMVGEVDCFSYAATGWLVK